MSLHLVMNLFGRTLTVTLYKDETEDEPGTDTATPATDDGSFTFTRE